MKEATENKWGLVISGADRRELSDAFRGSQWKDTWTDHASPDDDSEPYSSISVSLSIPDMDTLIAALKCVGHIRANHGISLYGDADFGSLRAGYSLCTKGSGFSKSSCHLQHTSKSLDTEMGKRLTKAQKALSELRMLMAESEST